MCHWASRLRSRIHSWDPSAWILLVLGCSNAHVDQRTLRRLRLLGILVIFIPARMTWLLQVCDVCVFASLKTALRYGFLTSRVRSADSQLSQQAWLRTIGEVVSRLASSADWSDSFQKCAQGRDVGDLHAPLASLLSGMAVSPKLPSLAEFADLVARPAHSELTRTLYHTVFSAQLALASLPAATPPRRGARVASTPRPPALPLLSSRLSGAEGPYRDAVRRNVRRRLGVPAGIQVPDAPARSWAIPPRAGLDV